MPRLPKPLTPPIQQEIERELSERHGATMTRAQVAQELHLSRLDTVSEMMKNAPHVRLGRFIRYRTTDVAKEIYTRMERS